MTTYLIWKHGDSVFALAKQPNSGQLLARVLAKDATEALRVYWRAITTGCLVHT